MKAVVFSDSHGNFPVIESIAQKNPDAELFIFLGDGIDEAETLSYLYCEKKFLLLRGNCDYGSSAPETASAGFCGKRIFYTHGYSLGVKSSIDPAVSSANEAGADILLFGHTHVPLVESIGGLKIMNPGSCGKPRNGVPSYGIIEISEDGAISLSVIDI